MNVKLKGKQMKSVKYLLFVILSLGLIESAEGYTVTLGSSDWNSTDCTDAIQDQLDIYQVDKIILADVGDGVWRVRPLTIMHHYTELYLNDGVKLQAKTNAYGANDCIITATGKHHLTLQGQPGGVSQIHGQRWDYTSGEQRHCVSLTNCDDLLIKRLRFGYSAGDGIYLGGHTNGVASERVVINDVVVEYCSRNGLSVISGEDIEIKNSYFRYNYGVGGQAIHGPWAGIDFEPNYDTQQLINIDVTNCYIYGNGRYGIMINLDSFSGDTEDVDIVVDDVEIYGVWGHVTEYGFVVTRAKYVNGGYVDGTIRLYDSEISDTKYEGIRVSNTYTWGIGTTFHDVLLSNCYINNTRSNRAPIIVERTTGYNYRVGAVGLYDIDVLYNNDNPYVLTCTSSTWTYPCTHVTGDIYTYSGDTKAIYTNCASSITVDVH